MLINVVKTGTRNLENFRRTTMKGEKGFNVIEVVLLLVVIVVLVAVVKAAGYFA